MTNEALRLADELNRAAPWADGHVNHAAAALLRQQAERIAGLEAERDRLLRAVAADTKMVFDLCAKRDQLRAEVERLRAAMTVPTIEPNSQSWEGMDGAIAFHLIERHADSWADAGQMMREWLEANAARTHKETK